jgi:hypothetical protein
MVEKFSVVSLSSAVNLLVASHFMWDVAVDHGSRILVTRHRFYGFMVALDALCR